MTLVLKPKHSLFGKSLLPVIMELKSNQPGMQIDTFARLKKDHPLEKYSLEELKVEFNRLTGETIQSLLIILSQEESVDLVRKIMHFSILHANNVGAPKGQVLTEIAPSAAGSSGPCTGNGDGAANLEDRLKGLEQNVSVLKSKSGEQKVDDAIRQVRLLAARPKLTPSHVLIASLEMLVDVAKSPMYNNFPLGFVPPMPMPGYIGFGQGRGGNRARNGQNSNPRSESMRCKRFHFHPHIPEWEKEALEFSPLDIPRRDLDISKCWVNYRGEFVLPPENVLLAESIVENDLEVGDCVPPHLILPLTVEHTKPRLCHDERFLNLWVMDKPFQLDTLKEVPRLVGRNHFMASVDDKSGYDHVRKLAFLLPEEKRNRFAELRDFILSEDSVDIKTLQRFAGKCISFVLVVPASRLYSREVHRAIGMAERNSRRVEVVGALREEIEFWKFLDKWNGFVSWRSERHLQISLATDSSGYKWGALVFSQKESFGDFWGIDDKRPIHLKEGDALLNALLSLGKQVENHRVDAYVDNKALVHVWENQGGKDVRFNNIMKSIFVFTEKNNVDLKLHFIPSGDNAADGPSRSLSFQDCQLSEKSWSEIQLAYGPHSVDLMALDSNVMLNERGEKLRHFKQGPSPLSSGINVFSQDVSLEDNPYVFPPFCLISVLLKFLESQRVRKCTVVVPEIVPTPVWWPLFWLYVESFIVLGNKGDTGVLKLPSKQGVVLDKTTPYHVQMFLIFKDKKGKTKVHDIHCGYLGKMSDVSECSCPKRLAFGTVQSLIGQLKTVFEDLGLGKDWDRNLNGGNPACAPMVKKYLKAIKKEQSIAHIVPKQAKPLFLSKLKAICCYIDENLQSGSLGVDKRFIYLRDQAFFKIQFFAGDRANDLGQCIAQEVKCLPDNEGLLFSHMVGKTLSNGQVNQFTIFRIHDKSVCPVHGLETYAVGVKSLGIDISSGYLFRPLSRSGKEILDAPLSSSVVYTRLKHYLAVLGVDQGETPHSLRSGCTISLALSGLDQSSGVIMNHIGWATKSTFERYSRISKIADRGVIGTALAGVASREGDAERKFLKFGDVSNLKPFL
uniref:Tyr recombinase domain-containing protein n=1 Tax=Magallana gigas TaxID=29159 RepID=A0A8W8L9T9_MAGGI